MKKKVESIPLKNTPEDRARLVEAKHRIDGITNPIAEAIMGTWVGIFGLFNQDTQRQCWPPLYIETAGRRTTKVGLTQ